MTLILNGTDNSATVPAVTGTTTNTGIYYPTTNQVAIATNGTQAMLVDASQNVGIGTGSPRAKVDVNGSIYTQWADTNFIGMQFSSDPSGYRLGLLPISSTRDLQIQAKSADGFSVSGITFYTGTGPSERMRIDSSGNVGIGTTAPASATNTNSIAIIPSSGQILHQHLNGTASGAVYSYFIYNGAAIASISQNGTTAVAYNTSSDYRLKENIAPITGALSKVAALKPVTYTWKSAPDETGEGFIAHELAEVCPQAVHGTKDAVDVDGNPVYQGIDTSFLVATLTAAIQELKAEFDAYKAAHP
jgi:hypothetical protein